MKKSRVSAGKLSDLVSQASEAGDESLMNLQTDRVAPRTQTREDLGDIQTLADSIKKHGQAQPIVVKKASPQDGVDADYIIVAGERRWRACVAAGTTVMAILRSDLGEQTLLELELIENFQRKNLTPFETAKAIEKLLLSGETKASASRMLGVSTQFIHTHHKLLDAPEPIAALYESGVTSDSETLSLLADLWRLNERKAQALISAGADTGVSRQSARDALREVKDTGDRRPKPTGEEVPIPLHKEMERQDENNSSSNSKPLHAEREVEQRKSGGNEGYSASSPHTVTQDSPDKIQKDDKEEEVATNRAMSPALGQEYPRQEERLVDGTVSNKPVVRICFSSSRDDEQYEMGELILEPASDGKVLVKGSDGKQKEVSVEMVQILSVV